MESKTENRHPIGKARNPVLVIIYSIITLGIYSFVYYYSLFEKIKKLARSRLERWTIFTFSLSSSDFRNRFTVVAPRLCWENAFQG